MRTRILLLVIALIGTAALPAGAQTADQGIGSDNIRPVLNIPHGTGNGGGGSDIEFFTIDYSVNESVERFGVTPLQADLDGDLRNGVQREYALAGTTGNSLHIYDITDPEETFAVSSYGCSANQGDSQIFTREEDGKTRTFATYTNEDSSTASGKCVDDLDLGPQRGGTFIIELTDPVNPVAVAFIDVPEGSHNSSIHPSGNFFYNSNSSLYVDTVLDGGAGIEYYDITDFDDIKRLGRLMLPPIPASLGTESHDIAFSEDGDRAYSAALSQGVIIDTEDPAKPSIITTFVDPTINVWHQADPITVGDRDFLVVEDEFIGAIGTGQCPNGGVHVFDITNELVPVKVGYWNIDEPRVMALDGSPAAGGCTAHVFRLYPEQGIMTIAYYNGGVRVVDLNGLTGIGLGDMALPGVGDPMVQSAFHRFRNSNSWSAKAPRFAEDGSFYLFSNDRARGLDVYQVDGTTSPEAAAQGRWMTPAEAELRLPKASAATLANYRMYCMLQGL